MNNLSLLSCLILQNSYFHTGLFVKASTQGCNNLQTDVTALTEEKSKLMSSYFMSLFSSPSLSQSGLWLILLSGFVGVQFLANLQDLNLSQRRLNWGVFLKHSDCDGAVFNEQ